MSKSAFAKEAWSLVVEVEQSHRESLRGWVDLESRDGAEPAVLWLRNAYALAEVLFATADGPPPANRLRWLCAQLADLQRRVGGRGMFVFRVSLALVSYLSGFLVFRPVPLSLLGLPTRTLALERWERSPAGLTLFALKAILCILYFEHEDAAAHLRFDGGCGVESVPTAGVPR